ncbi:Lcl C-terminal domain-containing protein [Thiomicrospira microaerophila]|uniref:Lcl C-terminal domain-containing protein n=1 Tax=Thiomicrospira microaerophila TaxID=406020 RepID=UPI000697E1EE|nr:DUF1566 domain-containing protein [Thiomicrospira microaerophila]
MMKIYGLVLVFVPLTLLAEANSVQHSQSSMNLISERFQDNHDGTLTDTTTQLIWMRCTVGQTWQGNHCHGEAIKMNWHQAISKAETYIYTEKSDWRLPTLEELRTLVVCSSGLRREIRLREDYAITDAENGVRFDGRCKGDFDTPTIDQKAFPDTLKNNYWTSTEHPIFKQFSWGVNFSAGSEFNYLVKAEGQNRYVRLIRDAKQ